MATDKNLVRDFGSDVRGADRKFLPSVVWALEQFEKKNNGPLAELKALVHGKKLTGATQIANLSNSADAKSHVRLVQFATPLDRILSKCLAETKFSYKDGKCTVKVAKNGGINADELRNLKDLLKTWGNLSVGSDVFKHAYPVVKKDKPAKDKAAQLKQLHNYLEKFAKDNGMSFSQVQAMATAKGNAFDA